MKFRDYITIEGIDNDNIDIDMVYPKAICIRGLFAKNTWIPKSVITILKEKETKENKNSRKKIRYFIRLKDWYIKKELLGKYKFLK